MTDANNHRSLLFMRHGETLANLNFVASGGDRNPDLTESGIAQAELAVVKLRRHGLIPHVIISSPSKRTMTTAQIISDQLNLELVVEPLLNERLLGDWNDVSSEIINPLLAAGDTPPNGESRPEFRKRMLHGLRNHARLFQHMPLLVGSRGSARILLEMVPKEDPLNFPNGAIFKAKLADSEDFGIAHIKHIA